MYGGVGCDDEVMAWDGMASHGMAWHGMAWHSMEWHGLGGKGAAWDWQQTALEWAEDIIDGRTLLVCKSLMSDHTLYQPYAPLASCHKDATIPQRWKRYAVGKRCLATLLHNGPTCRRHQ